MEIEEHMEKERSEGRLSTKGRCMHGGCNNYSLTSLLKMLLR